MGGVEMEAGVLFADVRGFTSLAQRTPTDEVAQLLKRFCAAASAVLTRSALIDKFVSDEVMARCLPQLLDPQWADELVRDAHDLLASVGRGTSSCRSGCSNAWPLARTTRPRHRSDSKASRTRSRPA